MGGYIGSQIFGEFLIMSILFGLLPFAGFVGAGAAWAMMEYIRKKEETLRTLLLCGKKTTKERSYGAN